MAPVSTKNMIKRAFIEADTDENGFITGDELRGLMRLLGDFDQDQMEEIVGMVDKNADGNIDYNEFVGWVMGDYEDGETKEVGSAAAEALAALGALSMDMWVKPEFTTPERGNYDVKCFPDDGSWKKVLEECEVSGEPFTDKDFPPEEKSIFRPKEKKVKNKYDLSRRFSPNWARIWDICGGEGKLFKDGAGPGDIVQGGIGNCYFLAALAAVVKSPAFLASLFPGGQKLNPQGVYAVRFFRDGAWRVVVVDDYLPCNLANRPCYAQPQGEYWVCLVEKAWAKLNGSYQATVEGQTPEAAYALTGCMIPRVFNLRSHQDKQEKDKLWEQLRTQLNNGSIISCTTHKQNLREAMLVAQHAYSIIDMPTITANGEEVKLVQLRNPHGKGPEWCGAFSDEDEAWDSVAEEDKAKFKREDGDGQFVMPFDDWCQWFSVCNFGEAWPRDKFTVFHARTEILEEGEGPCFFITPPEGGRVVVSACMQETRGLYGEDRMTKGAVCVLKLAGPGQENPKQAKFLHQVPVWHRGTVEAKVPKGSALVVRLKPHQEEQGKKDRSQRADLCIAAPIGSVLKGLTTEEMDAFAAEAENDPVFTQEKLALEGICKEMATRRAWDPEWADEAMEKLAGLGLDTVQAFGEKAGNKEERCRSINLVFNRHEAKAIAKIWPEIEELQEVLQSAGESVGWDSAASYNRLCQMLAIRLFSPEEFFAEVSGEGDINSMLETVGFPLFSDEELDKLNSWAHSQIGEEEELPESKNSDHNAVQIG